MFVKIANAQPKISLDFLNALACRFLGKGGSQ